MSDSVDLRYLKLPPAPPVSAPEQDCKPFEPPVPPVMSISDRRKRPVPIVPKPENMDRWKRPIPVVPRPGPENLPCPRCNSANTKFCYYNNNKLSQPRYFCRACRRYWTKGGILRDIPEGSGIARRYGRRSRRRADPAPMAGDPEVPVDGDNEGLVGVVCEGPAEGPSEGDLNEGLGEPFLNGWSLGYREEGLEVSRSAGFEEMGFGRPV